MGMSLRAARVNAGLTQKEAAKALNIGKNTITNYEKYRTKPNIDTAKKMAELYGVSIDDIFFTEQLCLEHN